jgi:NTP pyrophosphatase (non-canonical NTP hydrolase)
MDEDNITKNITDTNTYQEGYFKTALFPSEIDLIYCAMSGFGDAAEAATVVLGILELGIDYDPESETKDLQRLISELKKAIEVCSTIEVLKKDVGKGHCDIKPMTSLKNGEQVGIGLECSRRLRDSFDTYQDFTDTTAVYPEDSALTYSVLGLCNESGELAGKLKKNIRGDEQTDFRISMMDELGDCLYYIARVARHLDVSLSDVAQRNRAKLIDRKERGVIRGSGDNR